jgi:ribosomal protein S6--L-glutamate ligase
MIVGLLQSKKGPMVLQVYSSPGLEGIETAIGVDIAGEIIEYIERSVAKKRRPKDKVKA